MLRVNPEINLNKEQVTTQIDFVGQRCHPKKINENCKSGFKMLISHQLTDNVTMKKVMKHVFIPTPCVLDFFALSMI